MMAKYSFTQRMRRSLSRTWISALLAGTFMVLPTPQNAAAQLTFNVNSTADNANENPGDGSCSTGESVGTVNIGGFDVPILECTLRAAIEEANVAEEQVVIQFDNDWIDISPNGYSEIRLNSSLPYISNRVTIAGETHRDFEEDDEHPLGGRPTVFINGSDVSSSGIRFRSESSGSEVRHIAVGGFGTSAILLQGNLGSGSGNNYTISNNLIGGVLTDSGAILRYGNGSHGIDLVAASETGGGITSIRENIIFNNEGDGVHLRTGTSGTVFQNNIIGLLPIGESDNLEFRPIDGNGGAGIRVDATAGPDNIIGFFAGNTISNNGTGGVYLGADGQNVLGNHIGMPHDGNIASGYNLEDYGNDSNGIIVESSGNTIGGGGAATNVIGNSQFVGIRVGSGGNDIEANDNEIRRNYIGTDPDGRDIGQSQGIRIDNGDNNTISNVVIANNGTGIELRSDAGSNNEVVRSRITDNTRGVWFRGTGGLVGDTDEPGQANIIGNNTNGIEISGDAGQVGIVNNYIGTDETGTNLGNGRGVVVRGSGSEVLVGIPGSGNIIGHNTRGIELDDEASMTRILANYIGVHPNGDPIGNMHGIYAVQDAAVGPSQIGYPLANIDPDVWNPGEDFGNIIAYNTHSGINFSNAANASGSNLIRGNSIYGNGEIGIDLGMEAVDVGGGANGPNTLLNFPEFDADETNYNDETSEIEMRYRVRTNATNADYDLGIDVYLAHEDDRQGKTFLGTVVYGEDSAGSWVFDALPLPNGVEIESGAHIVATTSDNDWNTSQFSEATMVLPADAEILVSQQQLDFGSLTEGESETLSLTITSDGEADLTGEVTLADDAGGAFAITGGSGSFSLDPSEDLEVTLSFTPDGAGAFTGLLEISHNADNNGNPIAVDLSGTGMEPTDADLLSDVPAELSLRQNYPNPFNPATQIRFDLPESAQVRLDVYNSLGQRVATLVNETKSAGSYEISFDAEHLSSGTYLYRLEAGSEVITRTMTLVK